MKPAHVVYTYIIDYLRERAKELGYALTAHGSLARDIDLVAVPWVDEAAPAEQLVEALREKAQLVWGDKVFLRHGEPVAKPHGRRSWVMVFLGTHAYIDLSVMPRDQQGGGA